METWEANTLMPSDSNNVVTPSSLAADVKYKNSKHSSRTGETDLVFPKVAESGDEKPIRKHMKVHLLYKIFLICTLTM